MKEFNPWWSGRFKLNYNERDIYKKIKKFIDDSQIIALTGLRRVGKTTIMRKIISDKLDDGLKPENILYFSFDDYKDKSIRDLIKEYENLFNKKLADEKFLFLFDEIQKIDNWQEQIKIIYDLYKDNVKIIVSGSESLFIRKKSKESLAGRIFEFKVETLSFNEFLRFKEVNYQNIKLYSNEYSKLFEEFMNNLGFAELINTFDPEKISLYVKDGIRDKVLYKDIPSIFNIDDISVLDSILTNITENPGQLIENISYSKEQGISRATLSNYLMYLEEAFLIRKLYNYSKNNRKTQRKLKKYYPALISVNSVFSDRSELKSKIFENFIINQLRGEYFWRDPYKNEVDVIIDNEKVVPIEIKYGEIKDLKGIRRFMDLFRIDEGIVISKNQERIIKEENKKIIIIPAWKYFLERSKD